MVWRIGGALREIPQPPACVGVAPHGLNLSSVQPLPQMILGPLSDSTCLVKCLRGLVRATVPAPNAPNAPNLPTLYALTKHMPEDRSCRFVSGRRRTAQGHGLPSMSERLTVTAVGRLQRRPASTSARKTCSTSPSFLGVVTYRRKRTMCAEDVRACARAASPAPARPTLAQDAARPHTPHGTGLPAIRVQESRRGAMAESLQFYLW